MDDFRLVGRRRVRSVEIVRRLVGLGMAPTKVSATAAALHLVSERASWKQKGVSGRESWIS